MFINYCKLDVIQKPHVVVKFTMYGAIVTIVIHYMCDYISDIVHQPGRD